MEEKKNTIYVLHSSWYNGTVCMGYEITAYRTRELLMKTIEKLSTVKGDFPIRTEWEEVEIFETEKDVPILNIEN